MEQIKGDVKKSQHIELSPLPYHYRYSQAREGQSECPYLIAHKQVNGLGRLDPDANVAFSVGWQGVAFAINYLEQQICKSHPAGLPKAPAPPNTA